LNSHSRGTATFGITKFFDLTRDEFRSKVLMANPITPESFIHPEKVLTPVSQAVPTKFDWRDQNAVTPVKDQGQCGSCWAFSAVENIESMWLIAGKANVSTLRLSEQQVVDCDSADGGCDGGDTPTAFEYVIKAGGIESESAYPYTAENGNCKFQKSSVVASIKDWKYATSGKDEKILQQNLVSWGPLSICVDAQYWQYYTGGVLTAWECAWVNILDHCVQLVGYNQDNSTPYWSVRNSWGTDWGINGYIQLEMFSNACGLATEATTSVV